MNAKTKQALVAAVLVAVPVGLGATAHAMHIGSATLIGSDVDSDTLFEIDLGTAALTFIGPLGDPVVASLTWDPGNSILYGSSTSTNSLLIIDPGTGDVTLVGAFGLTLMHAIDYQSNTGTLYGMSTSTSSLYTINTVTGLATLVGSSGITVGGMAYDPINDIMYATDAGPDGSTGLYTIDLDTGAGTFVGSFDHPAVEQMTGLAFDPILGLYGTDNGLFFGAVNQLFRINAGSGEATLVGDLNDGNFLGLTFIPGPPALVVLMLGGWTCGGRRRRTG